MQETETWLKIGHIVGAHGVRGELRIYPASDFPERFEQPGQRWLQRTPHHPPQPVELVRGRYQPGKNLYVIQLANVGDRTQAEQLKGAVLLVPTSDRQPTEPGEFHVQDLIGLTAIHQPTGQVIGTVTNLFSAGNDLLEVTRSPQPSPAIAAPPEPTGTQPEPTERAPTVNPTSTDHQTEAVANTATFHPSHRKSKRRKQRKPKGDRPQAVLIPFVEEIVPVVDLDRGCMEVNPPAGLIDWLEDNG